jgi:enoyl-CoA hydratase/carnithine racemase
VTEAILQSPVPVVAALHGAVIGAGLELAASAHIRIAEAGARYSLPEGRRGIFVGGGASVRVGRLIGASRMMEMMLTGRDVEADEGLRIGLSHRLVATGEAREHALTVARQIASNAPLSNQMIMSALAHIDDMPAQAGLFTESLVAALTQTSPDARTRMEDFLDRRKGRDGPATTALA